MESFGSIPARIRYLEQVVASRRRPNPGLPTAVGATIGRVLIVESDRVYGDVLLSLVQSLFVSATFSLKASLAEADADIGEQAADLVIANPIAGGGDLLAALPRWRLATGCRVLLVAMRPPAALLAVMSEGPATGIFDRAAGATADLRLAIDDVGHGNSHISPYVLERLFAECISPRSLFGSLTSTERMVLGVIGDGSDDNVAANRLSMTPLGVKSIRQKLHRKLGVQHRGELQLRAAELGFVIQTPFGCLRPGLAALIDARVAARDGRSPRRTSTPHAA